MSDSRTVHLLIERPQNDSPRMPHDEQVLVRKGDRMWSVAAGHVIEYDAVYDAWLPIPLGSDLTVEDVQTLIHAALGDASRDESDAENHGPTKAAQYRRSAAETREAVARLRAALGMETP